MKKALIVAVPIGSHIYGIVVRPENTLWETKQLVASTILTAADRTCVSPPTNDLRCEVGGIIAERMCALFEGCTDLNDFAQRLHARAMEGKQ